MVKKLIIALLMLILGSQAVAYNVDDPNFWNDWKRSGDVELRVAEIVNQEQLSAKTLLEYAVTEKKEYAFYTGLLYYFGFRNFAGTIFPRDHKKALTYFNLAKEDEYLQPFSLYYIGMILWNGYDGVAINRAQAQNSLKQAQTPESFLILAAINYENQSEQLYWYKQLAYTDDWHAMLTVAHWYKIGRGTEKNLGESYYWYNRACSQNIEFACKQLQDFKL